jgi:alpha-L-rhamnosidase
MTPTPTHLRVEHFEGSVIGLGVACPRLSWRLPEGATTQSAYEIQVDGDRSKRIDGDRSVLVPWPFEPLQSRQAATWRVRVWTDDGGGELLGQHRRLPEVLDEAVWVIRVVVASATACPAMSGANGRTK